MTKKFGNEKVSLEFKEYRNEDIIAVRYVKNWMMASFGTQITL